MSQLKHYLDHLAEQVLAEQSDVSRSPAETARDADTVQRVVAALKAKIPKDPPLTTTFVYGGLAVILASQQTFELVDAGQALPESVTVSVTGNVQPAFRPATPGWDRQSQTIQVNRNGNPGG